MLILIERDSATKTPREVADEDEARSYLAQGFRVYVVQDEGEPVELLASDKPAAKKTAKKA